MEAWNWKFMGNIKFQMPAASEASVTSFNKITNFLFVLLDGWTDRVTNYQFSWPELLARWTSTVKLQISHFH